MSCNCGNQTRKDLDKIRDMAIRYAKHMEEDVQIHSWTERGIGRLYDFEPLNSVKRGKGIVEVIKFRDHKRKSVLSDSKGTDGDSPKPKKSKGKSKSTGGSSKAEREVAKSDDSVGESEAGYSSKEVD